MQYPTSWDLSPLFASDTDPQIEKNLQAAKIASHKFITKWKDRTDYLEKPEVLKQALDEYEAWARNFGLSGHAGYYFSLRTSLDLNDPRLKARENQIDESATQIANSIQFFTLRLGKIPAATQTRFLSSSLLSPYKHFLEKLFAAARYQLTDPEEKILNFKSAPAHTSWTRMTAGFIARETRDGQTFSQIASQLHSPDKPTRDKAFVQLNDIFNQYIDVGEHELNAILLNKKYDDLLRGLPRPDAARHLSDDISTEVVDTLISTVSGHYHLAHRFYQLKSSLLGLPKLDYQDRVADYGRLTQKYSYSDTVKLINSVFSSLDPQFGRIFMSFASSGRIDVYPAANKRGGAFCTHDLLTNPTYILLNHTNKLTDILTLAHEAGHGINNELMRQSQNALNFDTPLSTAEVASTFMEDFVLQKLMTDADPETRLALQVRKLDDDISTIIRQVACYQFEQQLHQDFRSTGYLSKDQIGALFTRSMATYMGDFVLQSPGSQNWWLHWSHIRSFFYVYSYASGLLISKSLQNSIKQNPGFITPVKEFLSAGSSDSPQNIFLRLGIDISQAEFWRRGLAEIENLLTQTTALAKSLGKVP